jgi:glycosyltransferase involved in cell wall biosynthesis
MSPPPPRPAERARGDHDGPDGIRVSVIVPVFNPGAGFDDLIDSLDAQTLRRSRFEVLLCDDGSNDETRERLDHVAATRDHIRVLHLAHTGWPGTPRNAGIDAARGTYVFFADQDDRLFPGALQDMCHYADAHSSDVLIGRVVGVGRDIPARIFRRDIPRAELGKDPLLELLTPHKLFRTAFVRENGIRFPDGKVRLEDHLFVMEAYFRAGTISVLASRPCYAWLRNKGSASSSRIDPEAYFPHLERVLALVERFTEPGPLRETLLRHWYRGKILNRLRGARLVRYPADYRTRFLDTVEPLVTRWFPAEVDAGLPMPQRVRSALLRARRRGDLVRLAEFETELECSAELLEAEWTAQASLRLTVRVRVLHGGRPLVFDGAGDGAGTLWHPPAQLHVDDLDPAARDAARDLKADRASLLLSEDGGVATDSRRRLPGGPSRRLDEAVFVVDPLRAFGWRDECAGGALLVDVRHAGWTFTTPLRAEPGTVARLGRSPLRAGRRIALRRRPDGTVDLVREGRRRAAEAGARAVRRLRARIRRRRR